MIDVKYKCMKYDMFSRGAIKRWDEAIPLGNGLCGALVYGDGNPLRISLDRGDLWDNRAKDVLKDPLFNYKRMKELVLNGKKDSLTSEFERFYSGSPSPTKLPAGGINIYFNNVSKITSNLNMYKAEAEVNINKDIKLRTFLHAEDKIGHISIKNCPKDISLKLKPHAFNWNISKRKKDGLKKPDQSVYFVEDMGYEDYKLVESNNMSWFVQDIRDDFSFGVVLGVKCINDSCMEAVYYIGYSNNREDWLEKAKSKVQIALDKGYEQCLKSHATWWYKYWCKSSISLPDEQIEKIWYMNTYLLGSCSRKNCPPMPLQGVWTADDQAIPPWKGDYHNDLNTQMCYYLFGKSNHLEQGRCFVDFLWELKPAAKRFAEGFFCTKGINFPSVMSIKGDDMGGWTMYSHSPTNTIWLGQSFYEYWMYSGDDEFLTNRAYPFFKEIAECLLDILYKDSDEKLVLPLSSSPEIHDNRLEAWLKPNSNYDLSLLIYLFKCLEKMAGVLNLNERDRWTELLSELPELAVNKNNILMISPEESLNESHRHHAHAMSIHPLRLIYNNTERNREIIDATIKNLETLGTDYWTGYSFAWMAEFYCIEKNGKKAADILKVYDDCFTSPNGFHLNGDYKNKGVSCFKYRPFTMEGNICAADAVQEMLLFSYNNIIELFPAVPSEWKDVSFESFRAEGGLIVSANMQNGHFAWADIIAVKDTTFSIKDFFDKNIKYSINNKNTHLQKKNGMICISLKKGEKLRAICG